MLLILLTDIVKECVSAMFDFMPVVFAASALIFTAGVIAAFKSKDRGDRLAGAALVFIGFTEISVGILFHIFFYDNTDSPLIFILFALICVSSLLFYAFSMININR